MHIKSGICFFITTWLELTQASPAYWFQHTICKMEFFQITFSLCLNVGSPVAHPAISPRFPNTLPLPLVEQLQRAVSSHRFSEQLDFLSRPFGGEELCELQ